MIEKRFKKFNIENFKNLVFDFIDMYDLGIISFYPNPDKVYLFTSHQLHHLAPKRDARNEYGFCGAWQKQIKKVRQVAFELHSNENSNAIIMFIDLNKKKFIFNKIAVSNISEFQIEELVKKNFEICEDSFIKIFLSFLKKYFLKILIAIPSSFVAGFLIYYFFKKEACDLICIVHRNVFLKTFI